MWNIVKTWLFNNTGGMLIAIIGVVGAYFAASSAANKEFEIWKRQTSLNEWSEVKRERIALIGKIHKAKVEAQNMEFYLSMIELHKTEIIAKGLACKKTTPTVDERKYCNSDYIAKFDAFDTRSKMANIQAEFFVTLSRTGLYYCKKTRTVLLNDFQNFDGNWWEIPLPNWNNLLTEMSNEIHCDFDYEGLMKDL